MQAQVLSTSPVQAVVDRILSSRRITRQDQRSLLSLSNLSREEQRLIDQVFDRLRMGLLKVVD